MVLQLIYDLLEDVPEETLRRIYYFLRAYLKKD